MKKFLTLLCLITCIFGLTACGSNKGYTEYEQEKLDFAESYVTTTVIPFMENFMYEENAGVFDELTAEELESVMSASYDLEVDGWAMKSAIASFSSGVDDVGLIVSIGDAEAVIDGNTIIVTADVTGEKRDAEVEVILSNDMFMVLESAALNPDYTLGELMGKAAINTVLGICIVFFVLIIICLIIYCFKFIPKIQAWFGGKKEDTSKQPEQISAAAAAEEEPVEEVITEEEPDDQEIIAVIAAAIAAAESESQAPAEGFVVRSIRRRSGR